MGIKAETSFSLADQLFNEASVGQLSSAIAKGHRRFKAQAFQHEVLAQFPKLALKERIHCLVATLADYLPKDFDAATRVLEAALPAPLDPTLSDDDFGEFIWVVPGEYVAQHGCTAARLKRSLAFLREATMRFSSESAIRPFLRDFPAETMAFVRDCALDDNYHVRRLASEGIRPYLPWALRVRLPIAQVIDVLSTLHADPTRYVTRSVANTLNDLSKDDPDVVIATLEAWRREHKQNAGELAWMTRHALRTLAKRDHAGALDLLGYSAKPKFSVTGIQLADRINVGDVLEWSGTLRCKQAKQAKQAQNLKIALRVYFLKANGSHSPKVFAVKDVRLAANQTLDITKRLSFKPVTTRTLYAGEHHIELLVNGVARGKRSFWLRE